MELGLLLLVTGYIVHVMCECITCTSLDGSKQNTGRELRCRVSNQCTSLVTLFP